MLTPLRRVAVSPRAYRAGPGRGRRVLEMAGLWLVLGVIIGTASRVGGGGIDLIAGALAGALILPWLGMFLGLLQGRILESAVGALVGSLAGLVVSIAVREVSVTPMLHAGTIMGGIAGANLSALLEWRRRRSDKGHLHAV